MKINLTKITISSGIIILSFLTLQVSNDNAYAQVSHVNQYQIQRHVNTTEHGFYHGHHYIKPGTKIYEPQHNTLHRKNYSAVNMNQNSNRETLVPNWALKDGDYIYNHHSNQVQNVTKPQKITATNGNNEAKLPTPKKHMPKVYVHRSAPAKKNILPRTNEAESSNVLVLGLLSLLMAAVFTLTCLV